MPLLASPRVPPGSARIGALPVRRRLVLALLVGLVLAAALIAVVVPRAQAGVPGRHSVAATARGDSQGLSQGSADRPPVPAGAVVTLHVIPFPGTPDAGTNVPIIFSSLHPSELRSV